MAKPEWEDYPWFAVIGALTLVSLFMHCTTLSNFTSTLLPMYLTEGLLFLAVGFLFYRGHGGQSWMVFLMGLIWFLIQSITWGTPGNVSGVVWMFCLGQGALAYMFFSGQKVKLLNPATPTSKTWGYAAVLIIMFYAVGKFLINVLFRVQLTQTTGWAFAVLLTSLGYLFPKHEYSGYMKLFGTLIAAYSALTIGGSGLTLLNV